jgi:hypothetical protein
MTETKSLDDHILSLYKKYGNQNLRWKEICNELRCIEEIPQEIRESPSFGVKVTRRLAYLCKHKKLERHGHGHKNVSYSLNEEEPQEGTIGSVIKGVGLYYPGCPWEKVRKAARRKMLEEWKEREAELQREWEEADEYYRRKAKKKKK